MSDTRKTPPCGDPDCRCSTGIGEELTFGSGNLDGHGYFEFPCRICADVHDRQMYLDRPRHLAELARVKNLSPAEAEEQSKRDHAWRWLPAWPQTDAQARHAVCVAVISRARDHGDRAAEDHEIVDLQRALAAAIAGMTPLQLRGFRKELVALGLEGWQPEPAET